MTMFSKDFTIDPRRLRVLREVGLRGTVTSAASGLHLTPSAVSQQIAALSRDLGVPLLEKTGRGVRLTGQAQVILTHATVVQAQFERARADLAAFADGRTGQVSVAGFATGIARPPKRRADHNPRAGAEWRRCAARPRAETSASDDRTRAAMAQLQASAPAAASLYYRAGWRTHAAARLRPWRRVRRNPARARRRRRFRAGPANAGRYQPTGQDSVRRARRR